MDKNIQIPFRLLIDLYLIICEDDNDLELYKRAKKGLEKKINAMAKRELYTKYKTAETEEEREKARQEYLDLAGIHKDWRY